MGVVALLALATALAAVVALGAVALGPPEPAPQAVLDAIAVDADGDGTVDALRIHHDGGDALEGDGLAVRTDCGTETAPTGLSVGESRVVARNCSPGDAVPVVWAGSDGQVQATLLEETV
jgi:hypothetical protein